MDLNKQSLKIFYPTELIDIDTRKYMDRNLTKNQYQSCEQYICKSEMIEKLAPYC